MLGGALGHKGAYECVWVAQFFWCTMVGTHNEEEAVLFCTLSGIWSGLASGSYVCVLQMLSACFVPCRPQCWFSRGGRQMSSHWPH